MSRWRCWSLLVSHPRGGRFKPFYCNMCNYKYFWIQWKHLGKNSIVRIGFFSILPVQICCRTYATKVKVCSHREFFYILQLYQFFVCFSLSLGVNISLYHIGLFDLLTCISLYHYCRVFSTVNGHRCAGFMNYKFAIDPNAWNTADQLLSIDCDATYVRYVCNDVKYDVFGKK